MFFMPESPRYLIEKERYEEAMKILRRLHFDGINEDWIQTEYNEIKTTIEAEKAVTVPGWLIMFRVPQWRTRLMCVSFSYQHPGFTPHSINIPPNQARHRRPSLHPDDRRQRRKLLPNNHVQRPRHHR